LAAIQSFDAFRLCPYGQSDRLDFRRLDGADERVLSWLRSANSSVLYFSGASGVGKSSVLAASVLPRLRDNGWRVIETRLFRDPVERLRTALIGAEPRLAKPALAGLSLRDLLEAATGQRGKKEKHPLLLVIDQFEEFLVLHTDKERETFTNFLVDLTKRPIENLTLLLIFRSDYRPLIFKLDLPPLVAGENWYELSPYGRAESMAFLRSGGRELEPESVDRLLDGLDKVEDTPGMYRLITLNMVGLVLQRMGMRLEGDPGRLIQSYLIACLRTGEARDYARRLLEQMITGTGTKEPRTETDLVAATGYTSWQVRATLAELARQGLVRRLAEGPWEIAHDFLARVIGQFLGRLRPPAWQRIQPLIAPVVLAGWLASAVVIWPFVQERSAEGSLREYGATISGFLLGTGMTQRLWTRSGN
jgi:hypothetical protein